MGWWSPVKVGLLVKDELSRSPRSGAELHRIYKERYDEEMVLSGRNGRRPMTYESFMKTLRFARYLGFIRVKSTKPMERAGLLTISDRTVQPSVQLIYALTKRGREAPEWAWRNLRGAVRTYLGWR